MSGGSFRIPKPANPSALDDLWTIFCWFSSVKAKILSSECQRRYMQDHIDSGKIINSDFLAAQFGVWQYG